MGVRVWKRVYKRWKWGIESARAMAVAGALFYWGGKRRRTKVFRKCVLLSVVMVLILGLFACGSPKGDLFPDSNLERAIWTAIGKPADVILPSDLEMLSYLEVGKGGITNLTELQLWRNQISDISPLVSLTNLTVLNIGENPLDTESVEVHIPQLEERGVEVRQ